VFIYSQMISYYFTVSPSSLRIEKVTPENRLLGTEGHDLTVSCKAEGGKPAPIVILIIDGQALGNKTQTVQHILTAINRSYDHKTVTCQASNLVNSQNSLTDSAVIYLNCK
jgi:translation initiation factor IF-2